MKRSQRLPLDDVRNVFRVLGDARELRDDYEAQEKCVVDAMTELLGADFGHAMKLTGFRPDTPTRLTRHTPGTVQDPTVIKYISQWGQNSDFDDDPLVQMAWRRHEPVVTFRRSSVMTLDELRPYRIYEEMVEPSGLYDVIFTYFRYPGSDTTRKYVFQRTRSRPAFRPRDVRMADLFITELRELYTEGLLETPSVLETLPTRLATLAHQLRTDKSQRQIAAATHLSYQTVRSYTRELYGIVGVRSREALVSKLFARPGRN